jgi:hypothetical protein
MWGKQGNSLSLFLAVFIYRAIVFYIYNSHANLGIIHDCYGVALTSIALSPGNAGFIHPLTKNLIVWTIFGEYLSRTKHKELLTMTIPAYLWLKDDGGADIKGSVDVNGREGSIETLAISHDVSIPNDE